MITFLKRTLVVFGVLMFVFVAQFLIWAACYGVSLHYLLSSYKPEVGDVLVQSIEPAGRLLRTIKGVTNSKWNHCGIVDRKNDRWVVCEAVGDGVQYTPLELFLLRGDEPDFAVYRLAGDAHKYAADLAECCKAYVGRPYDMQYELDDAKIYCSELVYKAYRDATQGTDELGRVQQFADLNWEAHKADLAHYHGSDDLPLDRQVVTPVSLTWSQQLRKVFEVR